MLHDLDSVALDNYITGHWGEDAVSDDELCEDCACAKKCPYDFDVVMCQKDAEGDYRYDTWRESDMLRDLES